ncbi:MAG: J domain-containing protein, partial [Archangium sp.]|nr:J domain-containing protein [Archangium sp.]
MRLPRSTATLEGLSVECTFCNVEMSTHSGGGGTVRYFHCPSCQRWVSSMYQEVFQADTKVRLRPTEELRQSAYTAVRDRLDRWLRSLDRKDPYRQLGCSPFDSDETLRAKYRELAKANHPDRGGNPEVMREIN